MSRMVFHIGDDNFARKKSIMNRLPIVILTLLPATVFAQAKSDDPAPPTAIVVTGVDMTQVLTDVDGKALANPNYSFHPAIPAVPATATSPGTPGVEEVKQHDLTLGDAIATSMCVQLPDGSDKNMSAIIQTEQCQWGLSMRAEKAHVFSASEIKLITERAITWPRFVVARVVAAVDPSVKAWKP
jgi:hypothetical protein